MHPTAIPAPFAVSPNRLWPPATIVLRQTTTLFGPALEAHTWIERFDSERLDHVTTVVLPWIPLFSVNLEANELLATELERALNDISPF